jgi:glutathione S-transferase
MKIVLYYAPNACSLVPYVTLTEANAAFDVRPLNFRKGQNMSADYLKLNPKHKVPLLVVDGKTLTENDLDSRVVCLGHSSFPVADQFAAQGL